VVAITFLALAATQARGDGGEADRLFEEGRTLAKAGDYAGACDRFGKSFAVDHAPGTALNIGDCQEHLGHLREAWQAFSSAANEFELSNETARAKFARDRATAIAAKLVEVVIVVGEPTLPGLAISVAGHEVTPAASITDHAEPGTITITATAPGHAPFTTSSPAVAGSRIGVSIPRELGIAAPVPAPAVSEDLHHSRVRLAYWLGGGGAAFGVTALAFSLVGKSHWSDAADGAHCTRVSSGVMCDSIGSTQIREAQHLADLGTGFAIGAGAFIATAAIIYVTAPPERVTVAPTASAQGAGVVMFGSF
jgi:hypothetical protein